MPQPNNQPKSASEGADFKADAKPDEAPEQADKEKLEARIKSATEEIIKKSDELDVTIVAYLEYTQQGVVPRVAVVPKEDDSAEAPTEDK